VAEWLAANAASGYVEFDAPAQKYRMSEEQAFALADPQSPAYVPGAFLIAMSMFKDEEKVTEVFRTGKGFGWHEHDKCLFEGTEKFFRPNYAANLVGSWIPALDGVRAKLEAGGRVADVGCGHGASTILMAKAFPRAKFFACDYHEGSIETARRAAAAAGVSDRVTFEIASAKTFPGKSYDLVAFFDCLHDMGDPQGAARHVLSSLSPEGSWMIVEPFAHDELEKNLNPVGRIFYSASTMICTPASKAQEVGLALGAQAGESRLRNVVRSAGFERFRRAAETPFNLVLEAKP
jgi:2-polyprenyl-3-methyl-5-hydroxy-6-metoxy-1,4-benzoquinol methylase